MQKPRNINKQQGLVSIVVTLIIMIVLTLIVTGFAQLARNEQRETLDRELSTQAFYAAESGINAARAKIKEQLSDVNNPNYSTNYTNCATFQSTFGNTLSTSDAQPTCILIKKDPSTLLVQNVLTNKSTILPIEQQGGGALNDLTISWQNQSGANTIKYNAVPANPFTASGAWGSTNVGILRIDLVPVNSLNPDYLRDRMFTAFLVPTDSSAAGIGNVAYSAGSGTANQGKIVSARCTGPSQKKCAVRIDGLNVAGQTKYYLRMKSIYNTSDVVICPSQGFACQAAGTLIKAQAVIDVTAKANDVLKRVQVRVNTDPNASSSFSFPEYTLDSAESICKLLTVSPAGTSEGSCP